MQFILPALFLGVGSALLELRAVYSLGWLRTLLAKHAILGLILSVVITVFLGALFGAAGLIAMMAATLSILITGTFYKVDRVIKSFHDRRSTRKIGA